MPEYTFMKEEFDQAKGNIHNMNNLIDGLELHYEGTTNELEQLRLQKDSWGSNQTTDKRGS